MTARETTPTSTVGPVHVAERLEPRPELAPGAVAARGRASELRQLADHDVDGGAREESRDHRLRQELGDPPEPEDREQHEQEPGRERDRRHELGGIASTELRHEHRAAGHGSEGRARAGRDVPRRAEERIDDRARRCRIEPVLQRHARDPGVAEVLRHDQRRHRDARDDVAAEEAPVVPRQPADHRHEAGESPRPSCPESREPRRPDLLTSSAPSVAVDPTSALRRKAMGRRGSCSEQLRSSGRGGSAMVTEPRTTSMDADAPPMRVTPGRSSPRWGRTRTPA